MKTILPSDLNPIETNALLCGGVGPRPIAFASTISAEGVRNLAPFSFFNAFGSNPPMVAFAPNRRGLVPTRRPWQFPCRIHSRSR